jgi:predicted ATP-grasp superfamily ATP-dependent carboligase
VYIEKLTEEIEDWLEKADDEETIRFLSYPLEEKIDGAIILEFLGYFGAVAQIVSKEIHSVTRKSSKIAGIFSTYFNEMIQLSSKDILLPISIIQAEIGSNTFIISSSNFPIPDIVSYQLAEELLSFYDRFNPSKILIVDGAHSYTRSIAKTPHVHRISAKNFDIHVSDKMNSNFTMMGQSASSFLLYHSNLLNIPVEMLIVDSFANYDPVSALEILKTIAQEFEIEIDFSNLIKEVSEFKNSFQDSEVKLPKIEEESTSDSRFFM